MIPNITVYTYLPPTNEDAQCIRMLTNAGFTPQIDAIHKTDAWWFAHHYKNNYRFFYLRAQELGMADYYTNGIAPSFTISYNDDEHLTDFDWRFLHRYFEHLFYPECAKPRITSRRSHLLLNTPVTLAPTVTPELVTVPTNNTYDLELKEIPDRNMCLCTVHKPNVDRPYTVVIRDYQTNGLRPFFTALFVSNSWGVAKADIAFLRNAWHHYMEGPFDLDTMLKEATEACYPSSTASPVSEPEVYRKSMMDTLKTLQDKEEGRLFKTTL